jgi:hypothetical protein
MKMPCSQFESASPIIRSRCCSRQVASCAGANDLDSAFQKRKRPAVHPGGPLRDVWLRNRPLAQRIGETIRRRKSGQSSNHPHQRTGIGQGRSRRKAASRATRRAIVRPRRARRFNLRPCDRRRPRRAADGWMVRALVERDATELFARFDKLSAPPSA